MTTRPWTPDRRNPDNSTTITVKTACPACSRVLGDATLQELELASAGLPLPHVPAECGCQNQPVRLRTKPVEVQAMQWTGDNAAALTAWTDGAFNEIHPDDRGDNPDATGELYVAANSVHLGIEPGGWIIRDSNGFSPCEPDVVAATYESVPAPGGPEIEGVAIGELLTERKQLADAPTGTVVLTRRGDLWRVDHGPLGQWIGARTRIHLLIPDIARTFYPPNFDRSLPVTAVWTPDTRVPAVMPTAFEPGEWWTAPMRTELGRRIHALFAHPCDGAPYSEDGYDDRGHIVTVRNLLAAVRLIEDDVVKAAEPRVITTAWELDALPGESVVITPSTEDLTDSGGAWTGYLGAWFRGRDQLDSADLLARFGAVYLVWTPATVGVNAASGHTDVAGYLLGHEFEGRWHLSDARVPLFADREQAASHVDELNDLDESTRVEPGWHLLEVRKAARA